MLKAILSLRRLLLIASLGAAFGAVLMFWEGGLKLITAAKAVLEDQDAKNVITPVMAATDTLFFGLVLIIVAYAIAVGFALELSAETKRNVPTWMRIDGIGELKQALVSVVLVFLIVDFATDWASDEVPQTWLILVKPISIFLIASALYLFSASHGEKGTAHNEWR